MNPRLQTAIIELIETVTELIEHINEAIVFLTEQARDEVKEQRRSRRG